MLKRDPRVAAVTDLLPGANCGGCGQAGCSAAAEAMVNGKIEVNSCVVGGTETAEAIGEYLGYDVTGAEPTLACSSCEGGYRAARKFDYSGLRDCRAALQLYHGFLRCENGCLGLGSCVRACKFSAITINPDSGLPIFDPERCVGCGSCVEVCPKGIVKLVGETTKILHWNQYTQCLSPCRQRCPAQINIPKYLGHARRGEYAAALACHQGQQIRWPSPPAGSARSCAPPNAGVPLTTTLWPLTPSRDFYRTGKRNSGTRLAMPVAADTGKKVAVVGGARPG